MSASQDTSTSAPGDIIRNVQVAADTADFARRGAETPTHPTIQNALDDQARRSLDAAWANPGAAAALRSAGLDEASSKAQYAANDYTSAFVKLEVAAREASTQSVAVSYWQQTGTRSEQPVQVAQASQSQKA